MNSKHTYIIGNWKMNGSAALCESLLPAVQNAPSHTLVEKVVCPPAVLLPKAVAIVQGGAVKLGGQDCHTEDKGAFTGDISAVMLKEVGASYVIVGHSERRQFHKETSALVAKKAGKALACGLVPVICIGETLAEREAGQAEAVVERQVRESLPEEAGKAHFLLAYEPVWAIGSGRSATQDDIQAMHAHVIRVVTECVGCALPVLYGGSVKAANAEAILATPGVSGVLVGGASLIVEEFCAMISAAVTLKG